MFCRQCEQTAGGIRCTVKGVCGKTADVAALQDILIYGIKSIGVYGKRLNELGVRDYEVDVFVAECLFLTLTNVNFDTQRFETMIRKAYDVKETMKQRLSDEYQKQKGISFTESLPDIVEWKPAETIEGLIEQGKKIWEEWVPAQERTIESLREILLFGLKGMSAYLDHVFVLSEDNQEVAAYIYITLNAIVAETSVDVLLQHVLELGKKNLLCIESLDRAHTTHFGHPEPTKVVLGVKRGPAIIISGHDLRDLSLLLEQTKNTDINIYTHGEMLPAHAYPEFKKYAHFSGHFGSAWQNQQKEFNAVPAAILMTTNCLQEPRASYRDRIYTTGAVGWKSIPHIESKNNTKDFTPLITKALELGGFENNLIEKEITVGYGWHAITSMKDTLLDLVKQKKIKHFFLIGGCDGAKPGRNYYTKFAQNVPYDSVILTLACGKFRFNRFDFGNIEGIPRLLDVGQCNDTYSAIRVVLLLSEALQCNINELPLSFIVSWYEQKAVVLLLTLLALGITNIRLGPSLPAFISPDVFSILVEKFHIKPIGSAQIDVQESISRQC